MRRLLAAATLAAGLGLALAAPGQAAPPATSPAATAATSPAASPATGPAASPATGPAASPATGPAATVPPVIRVPVTGEIDPLMADAVEKAVARAEREHATVVVLELDTPGGLASSMRKIVTAILGSDVPVAGWVGPSGGYAASAGTFILAATSYAAMAPETTIGAAHPVGISGQVLEEKVTNDAAAYIRQLAARNGRNADWYESAVRKSASVGAKEAVDVNAVNSVQNDEAAFLHALDGRLLSNGSGQWLLVRTKGAPVEDAGLGPAAALLHSLVDPNVAFLLFLLGVAGIVYEIVHPGIGVGGVAGAISLIVALLMFQALPVQLGGLALIALGVGLFVLDLKLAGHAFLSVFGVIALLLGGLLLYQPGSGARVHPLVLVAVVACVTALFLVVARSVMAARRSPPVTGTDALIGATGTVTGALHPSGRVRAAGLEWRARSRDGGALPVGTEVVVVGLDGLTLEVEPAAKRQLGSPFPAPSPPGRPGRP
ncbi:MAG TPA: nodulation protein NfeD [Actinomycetota bacterium]